MRSRPWRARLNSFRTFPIPSLPASATALLVGAAWALFASLAACAAPATPTVESVRAALEARRHAVQSVRGDVVVRLSAPEWAGAGTCEGLLAARRPGSLRLVGYAAVLTLFDTATDGRRFWVNLPAAGMLYTGAAGQESLLTRLPVPPGQIVAAVFGEPYGALDSTLAVTLEEGKTWLTWSIGSGRHVRARATFDPLRIARAELWEGKALEATIDYRDYRKRHGVWWPTRLDFAWPAESTKLSLEFGTVAFNQAIEEQLFRLETPEGSRVVEVGVEQP